MPSLCAPTLRSLVTDAPRTRTESADEGRFEELVQRLADLLVEVDQAGLHSGSVMAEAEDRLLDSGGRTPTFATSGGAVLVSYSLDTQGLRWWLRGTPASKRLARLSDEELVRMVERGQGARDAAIDRLDEYADWLGEVVTQLVDRDDSE